MKITVSKLRELIREILKEEADVPGRWRASNGEPLDDEDLDRLAHGGFLSGLSDDENKDDLEEA